MKNYFLKNRLSCLICLISILIIGIYIMSNYKQLNNISNKVNKSDIYNLLTINTIFSGFLYTMLGNMVEFSTRSKIKQKDRAGYIDKYYSPIYFGLTFFMVSIFLQVLVVFFDIHLLIGFTLFIQKTFAIVGILYFIVSAFMLRKMINKVRKDT